MTKFYLLGLFSFVQGAKRGKAAKKSEGDRSGGEFCYNPYEAPSSASCLATYDSFDGAGGVYALIGILIRRLRRHLLLLGEGSLERNL